MDDAIVSEEDLGCQFFLEGKDVGKRTRAESSLENLQALNPLAKVIVEKGDSASLTEDRCLSCSHPNPGLGPFSASIFRSTFSLRLAVKGEADRL